MSGTYVALGDSMSIDDYAGGVGRGASEIRRTWWQVLHGDR